MAEKILIEVDIDSEDAGKGLEKVEKGVTDIGKASDKTSKGVTKFGKSMGGLLKGAGIIGLISTAIAVLQTQVENLLWWFRAIVGATIVLVITQFWQLLKRNIFDFLKCQI